MNFGASILPVFAIILCGWLAGRTAYVSDKVETGLTEFVFNIAIPALIFNALATAGAQGDLVPGFWLAYFGGAALVWLLCGLAAHKAFGQPYRAAAMLGFSTSQSNTVFLGVPIILHVYGEAGALPLFMLLALHMPIMMGAASVVLEARGQGALPGTLWKLARSLLRNPMFLALLAGGLFRLTGWTFSGMPQQLLATLGGTASPCALFALGLSIQRLGLSSGWKEAGLISFGKLLLHPLAVWLLATQVFSMPPVFAGVATLFAAMPVGINSYLLAMRYQANETAIAMGIALSTLLSVCSTVLWITLLTQTS